MLRFVLVAFLIVFVATAQVSAHSAKDPVAALMLGLIFPSGGQIYNEQYEKVPWIWGGLIGSVAVVGSAEDSDEQRIAGIVVFVGTWLFSIFDAAMSADKINIEYHRRNRFGHLMEFDGDRVTLGVDPLTSHSVGTMLSLRF